MFEDIKEICLVGYYGFGNIGDDAILLAALEEYTKAYNLYVRVLVNMDPYLNKMLRDFQLDNNVTFYDRWDIKQINEAIYYSDAVIFGGGGLFQDKTSIKSFLYYFSIALLAKMKKKKIIIERNSIGPITSKLSKFLFSKVLDWTVEVSMRDKLSLEFIKTNYPKYIEKYKLKEDFVLSPISCDIFKKFITNVKKYDVLFILRDFDKIGEVLNTIQFFKESLRIKIIVFQEKDIEQVGKYLPNVEYPGKGEVYKTLQLIEESRIVVSNRLHGVIFSYLRGVKTLAISIDPKIEGFCKDYNIDYVDANEDVGEWIKKQILLLSNSFSG